MRTLRERCRKKYFPVGPFNFELLPVELKHEVLTKLKTEYLTEVCSKVNTQWEGMVSDIVNLRIGKIDRLIPAGIRAEIEKQIPPDTQNVPVELLKLYERSKLSKRYNVTAIQVNEDALRNGKGIVFRMHSCRPCDCGVVDECIVQSVGLMHAMSLLVVKAAAELQFFNLKDLERLNDSDAAGDLLPYHCIDETTNSIQAWSGNSSTTDISVFRDQVATEETSKTILLLKVVSCDHENRKVTIQRLRRIHLPLWSRSLCLLEDKLFIAYSTGNIGKWCKKEDELSISDESVIVPRAENLLLHNLKLYRVANLVFVKFERSNRRHCNWFVHDPEDKQMTFYHVPLLVYITGGYLQRDPSWECTEVFHLELFCNFLIVHCQVQCLIPAKKSEKFENRLLIKRVKKFPTLADFMDKNTFVDELLVGSFVERTRATILNGSVISLFLPSLKPWQLEPPTTEPIPVADIVSIEWSVLPRDGKRKRKLRVYRVRIANLPLKDR